MAVPNTFATDTTPIPLADLDANFSYYDTAYSIVSTTVTFNGNIGFAGTGKRIIGDFSSAPVNLRVAFETSTTNGNTVIPFIPNGTGNNAGVLFYNASDTQNSARLDLRITATEASYTSTFSGTGTYLPMTFYTGGSVRVRIDTSGNVGIGTTSPQGKLNVSNAGAAGFEFFINNPSGGVGTYIQSYNRSGGAYVETHYYATSHTFRTTASATSMVLDSSGKVGINVTPAAGTDAKLQVTGGTTNATTLATSYSAASTVIVPKSTSGYSLAVASGTGDFPQLQVSANGAAAGDLLLQPYGGNVGIGTSSPSYKLQVSSTQGTQAITSTTAGQASYLILTNSADSSNSYVYAPNKQIGIVQADTSASSVVYFSTQNTERMRIDSSGNVGIGATPGTILDVYKASGNPYFRVYTGTGSVQGYMQAVDSTYVKMGSLSSHDLGLVTGGTEAVRITAGGNVGIGTSSPNASAILDVQSTTKGVRFPNMTTTQKNAISSPAAGLVVFDTTLSKLAVYSGSAWQTITSV